MIHRRADSIDGQRDENITAFVRILRAEGGRKVEGSRDKWGVSLVGLLPGAELN
jgi:hypothetical protein